MWEGLSNGGNKWMKNGFFFFYFDTNEDNTVLKVVTISCSLLLFVILQIAAVLFAIFHSYE